MDPRLDIIYKRRSIRIFDRREVEKEKLEELLQAAMAAPSASNGQPWEFIVVTDPDQLSKLQSKLQYGNYNAPAAIAVLANLNIAKKESSFRFWVQDCSAATENILVAAAGLGLGSVWIGAYPKEEVTNLLHEILEIPEGIHVLNLIYVGYPAEEKPPRTQYEEERVHWQKY
ncbi:MAG: nitroreductase family protein [Anaerolineaceae bacterium]|jgi:nitroreductase|nr:MAG: nitroreductase family protein [Anaerolineaceae bacterium]